MRTRRCTRNAYSCESEIALLRSLIQNMENVTILSSSLARFSAGQWKGNIDTDEPRAARLSSWLHRVVEGFHVRIQITFAIFGIYRSEYTWTCSRRLSRDCSAGCRVRRLYQRYLRSITRSAYANSLLPDIALTHFSGKTRFQMKLKKDRI